MKKSKTIIFSILSICLTCALFVVFVFAVLDKKSMFISNSFTFDPESTAVMKFEVYGECSNSSETEVSESRWKELGYNSKHDYLLDKSYIYHAVYDNAEREPQLNDWNIGNLTFIDKETPIKYTFKITNNSYEKDLVVNITQFMEDNDYVYNMVYTYNDVANPTNKIESSTLTIPKGDELTETNYTMIIELVTSCYTNTSASCKIENNFRLDFSLQ